jgi:light-regulated signal transduction histidine kinase (bacteriophytochrome)
MEIDTMWGICMVVTDISQQKRVEEDLRRTAEELMRSNAELEQLAYVASHDLQEPLRMVTSFVQLLQRRYEGQIDAKADKWITYAADGTVRMQQLIDDLLLFLWTGRHQFTFEPTDCEQVLQTVLANLKLSLTRQSATITHDPLPIICADELQITRLFQNLIGNAVKFHSAAPLHIHVSAKLQGATWVFSVCDNGIGIEPQYAERVFEIFQRLHTHDEYPGTGIGLTICKKIVERHGGRIWVESELGRGAAFRFVLRATEESHHGPE